MSKERPLQENPEEYFAGETFKDLPPESFFNTLGIFAGDRIEFIDPETQQKRTMEIVGFEIDRLSRGRISNHSMRVVLENKTTGEKRILSPSIFEARAYKKLP